MSNSPRGLIAGVQRRVRRVERNAHRRLLAFGSNVTCPVCGWHGLRFAPGHKPRRTNRICPSCVSSERYRALELALREMGPVAPGTRLLEVAPIKTVEQTAVSLGYQYTSIDLSSPTAQVLGDLVHIPFGDATFDVVVCFHVLEHIPDDRGAVAELARIVGPMGRAIVVVPRESSRPETFEDPTADPSDYEMLYGQSDHVRIYGADVVDRWLETGVSVTEEPWADWFSPEVYREAALLGDDDRFWMLRSGA